MRIVQDEDRKLTTRIYADAPYVGMGALGATSIEITSEVLYDRIEDDEPRMVAVEAGSGRVRLTVAGWAEVAKAIESIAARADTIERAGAPNTLPQEATP